MIFLKEEELLKMFVVVILDYQIKNTQTKCVFLAITPISIKQLTSQHTIH